ncbi:MAG: translation initiation factor IF-2 [Chloroflexi bacterium]|nr:translation initiation factor IF-2 [Chloroflexota bacterium]MBV9897719.1 translation initiation factor IF-2 [Chloroflexota bacterium]
MPRPGQRSRPANRPGQSRGGRRGQLEAFERRAEAATAIATRAAESGPIELPSVVSVADLAGILGVPVTQVIKTLFTNGTVATINQALDYDTAAVIASDLGFEVREQRTAVAAPAPTTTATPTAEPAQEAVAPVTPRAEEEDPATLKPRPPVVTIMGHVDHGKTSLLDAIRDTRVAAGEAGGITQHIGAYQVEVNGSLITFLDTPGHEAFTAMRARGAQVTDIAVIVVAADDGVMPQTREAIDHARAAGVPIIVAINKIDMVSANPDRVKQELADLGVVVTEYGGNIEAIPVSARTQEGISTLLETIQLVAEAEVEPRANPDRLAVGAVIEAKMDKSRGAVATLLVQRGTLHVGDLVVAGSVQGRLKALFNDRGQRVKDAPPSFPVEVLGLSGVPAAGDRFMVVADERAARAMVEAAISAGQRDGESELSIEAVFARIRSGAIKELNLIVKADVQGSVEPIVNSLEKLGDQTETRAKVIHSGLGNVNVNDVNLADASKAMIIAFNVKTEADAKRAAELQGVSIREYSVIYTLVEEVEQMLTGMLEPRYEEVVHGHARVRATFKAGRRTIAGCIVADGVIHRRDRVRFLRGNQQVWEGNIASLRRERDDVNEVREGFECGILLDGWDDIGEGDTMEMFTTERV